MTKKRADSGRRGRGSRRRIESPGRRSFLGHIFLAAGAAGALWWGLGRRPESTPSPVRKVPNTPTPTSTPLPPEVVKALKTPFAKPYGTLVEEIRPHAPNQLYVIGQMHRAPGGETEQAAADEVALVQGSIYRICEHIIKNYDTRLFLREQSKEGFDNEAAAAFAKELRADLATDGALEAYRTGGDELLFELLNDLDKDSATKNVLDLLPVLYDVVCRAFDHEALRQLQVLNFDLEMELLHKKRASILEMLGTANTGDEQSRQELAARIKADPSLLKPGGPEYEKLQAAEAYFRAMRSGYALLEAPRIAAVEFQKSTVPNKHAVMVFGDDHLEDMIGFAKADRIDIPALASKGPDAPEIYRGLHQDLGFKRLGYGVKFIKPLSLIALEARYQQEQQ